MNKMFHAAVAAALALCVATSAQAGAEAAADAADQTIRPFKVQVPAAELADLRRRIAATRWPDPETVADQSQGVQLAKLQALVSYWGGGYDWRKAESRLNALPQYVTTIDGVDIHFIWVRSKNPGALPLIITHGWPGSVLELLGTIGPLTDPVAHGGQAGDAFDVVIPSIPGFGFSGKPAGTGWDPDHIARAWTELMRRLGYTRYVAQGGDWGAPITSAMARQAPAGLLGIHLNYPASVPPEIDRAIRNGDPAPAGLSADESDAFESLKTFAAKGAAYRIMMGTRPQTLGYGLADSPVAFAAFMYDYNFGEPQAALGSDQVLDDVSLYWLTNTAATAARIYWENGNRSNTSSTVQKTADISIPVAVSVFPGEIYRAPKSWTQRAYRNLVYFHQADKGGHFAAWEQPEIFSAELRAAFRPLRTSTQATAQGPKEFPMNTTRFAKVSAPVLLAAAAFNANAGNSESGGGPIDFGGAATVYIGPPGLGSDGGATPPLAQQDLGQPAVVTIAPPDPAYNDGATREVRVAHRHPDPAPFAGDDGLIHGTR